MNSKTLTWLLAICLRFILCLEARDFKRYKTLIKIATFIDCFDLTLFQNSVTWFLNLLEKFIFIRLEFGSNWDEGGIESLEINIFAGLLHWTGRQIDFGELYDIIIYSTLSLRSMKLNK